MYVDIALFSRVCRRIQLSTTRLYFHLACKEKTYTLAWKAKTNENFYRPPGNHHRNDHYDPFYFFSFSPAIIFHCCGLLSPD